MTNDDRAVTRAALATWAWRGGTALYLTVTILRGLEWSSEIPDLVWQAAQFGPILAALVALIALSGRPSRADRENRLFFIGIAAFLVVAALTLFTSVSPMQTVSQVAISSLMFLFIAWNALARWPRDPRAIRGDIVFLALFFSAVQVGGLILLAASPSSAIGDYGRFIGLYNNASYTGIISALTITVMAYLAVTTVTTRACLLFALTCAPLLVTLVLSGSRASWIATAVSLAILVVVRYRHKALSALAVVLALAICVLVVLLPVNEIRDPGVVVPMGTAAPETATPTPSSSPQQSATPGPPETPAPDEPSDDNMFEDLDEQSSGRLGLYTQAVEAWLESPILGSGFRTAPLLVGGFQTHNLALQVLVETGILGLAALGLCVAAIVLRVRSRRADLPLLAALICIFITELSSSSLFGWGGSTALYSWTIVAAFVSAASRPVVEAESRATAPVGGSENLDELR
jgi:O-antigen ligase